MRRTRVSSTTLKSVGYDARRRVLELEFASGAVYRYAAVPPAVHAELMSAESKGGYFNAHVKDLYVFAQVG